MIKLRSNKSNMPDSNILLKSPDGPIRVVRKIFKNSGLFSSGWKRSKMTNLKKSISNYSLVSGYTFLKHSKINGTAFDGIYESKCCKIKIVVR